MIYDQIERNLLILLDPAGDVGGTEWHFIAWRMQPNLPASPLAETEKAVRTVYCFERRDLAGYFLFRWYAIKQGLKGKRRNLLYMNDGLMSSLFDAKMGDVYRAFSASHLPRQKKLRQRLVSLLPLSLRAEKRYVIMGGDSIIENKFGCRAKGDLVGLNFMFFSNAGGKILLARGETVRSGEGTVYKTTTNADYETVMEREFATMSGISSMQGKRKVLPSTGKRFRVGDRIFFTEEYVKGKTLREIIHGLSRRDDEVGIRVVLERLDGWFATYSSLFQGDLRPLSSCYEHLFNAFTALYGSDQKAAEIMIYAREALAAILRGHNGVTVIVAHNDLWPGNFIVNGETIFAIDWERAVPDRSPFFEYYWMIISAVLEYYVSRIGVVDYSLAFRRFLAAEDAVSGYASDMLSMFLESHALDKSQHWNFLLLFLMEWSIQGYLALGRQTAMDRLAFRELLNFAGERPVGNRIM